MDHAVPARWRWRAHLVEVVCLELLVCPLEEQLDGLLQVGAFRGGVAGHRVQSPPVQPPCRSLVPATHTSVLFPSKCRLPERSKVVNTWIMRGWSSTLIQACFTSAYTQDAITLRRLQQRLSRTPCALNRQNQMYRSSAKCLQLQPVQSPAMHMDGPAPLF